AGGAIMSGCVRYEQILAEPLSPILKKRIEHLRCVHDVQHLAILPDVHISGKVCVGMALGTSSMIYPEAVGADIGCGFSAVPLKMSPDYSPTLSKRRALLSALCDAIAILSTEASAAQTQEESQCLAQPLSSTFLEKAKRREGIGQLGTLGRGNHFLELQIDQHQQLWLTVHSGSRHMGQVITQRALRFAETQKGGLLGLEADSEAGQDYLHDLEWAIRYAALNRHRLLRTASLVLHERWGGRTDWEHLFSCQHNHIVREEHHWQQLWVHRKGTHATHAGVHSMIAGSMGTPSVHVVGRGDAKALCSSAHGAGRRLHRTDARKRISPQRLEQQMKGVVFRAQRNRRLCEEAPEAYKDVLKVVRAQKRQVKVLRTLHPLVNYKGL
ncbi:MAG: RtcB family protein, partial [Myxococcota bacterium]